MIKLLPIKTKSHRGRGNASKHGNTCGRGQKGQRSRSGFSQYQFFSGGQTPLNVSLPKHGFTTINKFKNYHTLNLNYLGIPLTLTNPNYKSVIPTLTQLKYYLTFNLFPTHYLTLTGSYIRT